MKALLISFDGIEFFALLNFQLKKPCDWSIWFYSTIPEQRATFSKAIAIALFVIIPNKQPVMRVGAVTKESRMAYVIRSLSLAALNPTFEKRFVWCSYESSWSGKISPALPVRF